MRGDVISWENPVAVGRSPTDYGFPHSRQRGECLIEFSLQRKAIYYTAYLRRAQGFFASHARKRGEKCFIFPVKHRPQRAGRVFSSGLHEAICSLRLRRHGRIADAYRPPDPGMDADPRPSRRVIQLMSALPAGRPKDAVRERQRTGPACGAAGRGPDRGGAALKPRLLKAAVLLSSAAWPTPLVPPRPRMGENRFVRRGGTVRPCFAHGEPSGQPDPFLRTRGLVRIVSSDEAGR